MQNMYKVPSILLLLLLLQLSTESSLRYDHMRDLEPGYQSSPITQTIL